MRIEILENFPTIATPRVELRRMTTADTDLVFAFNSDAECLRFVARDPFTSIDQAEAKLSEFLAGYDERRGVWWTFADRESGRRIGYGGLFDLSTGESSGEIGYGLLRDAWGRGYVSEIVPAIVRFGFGELELQRIDALVVPGNTASERALARQGFTPRELVPDHSRAQGRSFDMRTWAMDREAWSAAHAPIQD